MGEILLEVETDKAVVEIEATLDGVLAGVKAHEGDVVPVGKTIAWLVAPGEEPPVEAPAMAPAALTMTATPAQAPAVPREIVPADTSRAGPQISPTAPRLPKAKAVHISNIRA